MTLYSWQARSAIVGILLNLCLAAWVPAYGADQEVLFEDDFSALDGSFDPSGFVKASVANNVLTVDGEPGYWRRLLYQNGVFGDVDLSAEFQLASPDAEKGAYVGLVIWARDYNDFTTVAISDSGTLGAFASTPTNTLTKISWRQLEGLKRGPSDWNQLRVVAIGKRAVVFLNGKAAGSFKGQPVDGGNLIGMIYSSGSEASTGRIRNLKVLTPKGDEIKAPEGEDDPNMILSDDFTELDSGWGEESASLSVKDQKLVVKPEAGHGYRAQYQSQAVTDIDATVKLRLTDNDPESGCAAGMVFWLTGSGTDYFSYQLTDSGQFGVSHWAKDRWLNPLSYRAIPAEAKFDPAGANEMRVVTNGKKATVYLNGVSVGTITNTMPVKGDWQFGVYAECGKTQATAEFSSLRIRKPASAAK
ncbi:MAG: hypothetical protein U0872_06145 [Planctomycetaceae bacterium]